MGIFIKKTVNLTPTGKFSIDSYPSHHSTPRPNRAMNYYFMREIVLSTFL